MQPDGRQEKEHEALPPVLVEAVRPIGVRRPLLDFEPGSGVALRRRRTRNVDIRTIDVMQPDELRAIRKAANLSQGELADEIGMARETISAMERGSAPIERRTELAVLYVASLRHGKFVELQREMSRDLNHAFHTRKIQTRYRPVFNVADSGLAEFETYLTWETAGRGLISQEKFVLGDDPDILDSALLLLLEGASALQDLGWNKTCPMVHIDLLPHFFQNYDLPRNMAVIANERDIDLSKIILNIDETTAMSGGKVFEISQALVSLGTTLAISHYGTGFSTLDYLKKIPSSAISIDTSFTSMLLKSQSDRIMIHSTIQLAHSLGQRAGAAGVGDLATLKELRRMGCDFAHGPLWGTELSLDDVATDLADRRRVGINA